MCYIRISWRWWDGDWPTVDRKSFDNLHHEEYVVKRFRILVSKSWLPGWRNRVVYSWRLMLSGGSHFDSNRRQRVKRPKRRTSVLFLDVPKWVEENEIKSDLIRAGVPPGLCNNGKSYVASWTNRGRWQYRVIRIDVPYSAAITFTESPWLVLRMD